MDAPPDNFSTDLIDHANPSTQADSANRPPSTSIENEGTVDNIQEECQGSARCEEAEIAGLTKPALEQVGDTLAETAEPLLLGSEWAQGQRQAEGVIPTRMGDHPKAERHAPPLPIDHNLTEPIVAFYKLQFVEPGESPSDALEETSGFSYYMQTLDVTIGRRVKKSRKKAMGEGEGISVKQETRPGSSGRDAQVGVQTQHGTGGPVGTLAAVKEEPWGALSGTMNTASASTISPQPNFAMPMPIPAQPEAGPSRLGCGEDADTAAVAKATEDESEDEIDVDLGALKSVSRLHARIGYSYTLSKFYLEVLGRNGAWVDDVFAVRGTRVALGPYTKIQISTRTFYFILPPSSSAPHPDQFSQGDKFTGSTGSHGHGRAASAMPVEGEAESWKVQEPELDLNHLFQRPASFNAFAMESNSFGSSSGGMHGGLQQWEAEKKDLFGFEPGASTGVADDHLMRRRSRKGRRRKHREDCARFLDVETSQHAQLLPTAARRDSIAEYQNVNTPHDPGCTGAEDENSYCSTCDGSQFWSSGRSESGSDPEYSSDSDSDLLVRSSDEREVSVSGDDRINQEEGNQESSGGSEIIAASDDEPDALRLHPSEILAPLQVPLLADLQASLQTSLQPPLHPPPPASFYPAMAGSVDLGPSFTAGPLPPGDTTVQAPIVPATPTPPVEKKLTKKEKAAIAAANRAARAEAKKIELEQKRLAKEAKERDRAERLLLKQLAAASEVAARREETERAIKKMRVDAGGLTAITKVDITREIHDHVKRLDPAGRGTTPALPALPSALPSALPDSDRAAVPVRVGVIPMPPPYSSQSAPVPETTSPSIQQPVKAPLLLCSAALPDPNSHALGPQPPPPLLQDGRPPDPSSLPNPHTPVSVPIPPLNKGPRPPPGPILGLDGQPFIGPEPLKPDLTYATIIYRALANVARGRGTLGQVCDWVAGEWEWFRLNPDAGWQNSIRHNLSLNKAFLKVPRIESDDPESKGSVWILDPVHAPEFADKERKAQEIKEAKAKRDAEKGITNDKAVAPAKSRDPKPKKPSTPLGESPPPVTKGSTSGTSTPVPRNQQSTVRPLVIATPSQPPPVRPNPAVPLAGGAARSPVPIRPAAQPVSGVSVPGPGSHQPSAADVSGILARPPTVHPVSAPSPAVARPSSAVQAAGRPPRPVAATATAQRPPIAMNTAMRPGLVDRPPLALQVRPRPVGPPPIAARPSHPLVAMTGARSAPASSGRPNVPNSAHTPGNPGSNPSRPANTNLTSAVQNHRVPSISAAPVRHAPPTGTGGASVKRELTSGPGAPSDRSAPANAIPSAQLVLPAAASQSGDTLVQANAAKVGTAVMGSTVRSASDTKPVSVPKATSTPSVPVRSIAGVKPVGKPSTAGEKSLNGKSAVVAKAGNGTPSGIGNLNIPANKQFPIVVKPIPPHLRTSALNTHSHILDGPPLVVDDGTIILNPSIFSHLTPEQLKHLQSLGAQQTLQILQAYIVQHLREKLKQQGGAAKGAANASLGKGAVIGSRSTSPAASTSNSPVPVKRSPAPAPLSSIGTLSGTPKPPLKPVANALPPNLASNPAITALLASAQQLAARTNTAPGKAPALAPAGTQPPAETLRVIAQLAATAGNVSNNGTQPLSPNAVALLQYLRQVGAGANMATAAQILATGVTPESATQARVHGKPGIPQKAALSTPALKSVAQAASGAPQVGGASLTPAALLAALNGVPQPSSTSPSGTGVPSTVLGKRQHEDTPMTPETNEAKRQKV